MKITTEKRNEIKAGMIKYVKKRKSVDINKLYEWTTKKYNLTRYDVEPVLWSLTAENILTFSADWQVVEGRGFNWIDC